MKAIVLRRSGKPGILKVETVPEPQPAPGEVLVKLHYTGVNYADILSRKGLYGWAVQRPYVPGMEGAGIIEAVGSEVDPSRIGEAVIVGTQNGCYAEKVAVAAERTLPVMPQYSMAENAAFAVTFMTAWVSIFELAALQPGEKLLITAAAGGVGSAAVKLGAAHQATVIGMAGNQAKLDYLQSLGASMAINYRDPNWKTRLYDEAGSVNVVLEMVGGEINRVAFDLMQPFGRMIVTGFASLDLKKWNPLSWWQTWRDMPKVSIPKMAEKTASVMASHLGYLLDQPELMQAIFARLCKFVETHKIRPEIGKIFPFAETAAAHTFIESRQSTGKILLQHKAAEQSSAEEKES